MSLSDVVALVSGMAGHEKKLKKLGTTPRENMLLAYQHKVPYTIPSFFIEGSLIVPIADLEHSSGYSTATDGFGVEWTWMPEHMSYMPTPEKHILENITDWKEKVIFPDVWSMDWEAQAEHDIHMDAQADLQGKGYQRLKGGKTYVDGNKCGMCLLLNGMFERLHALMGMEGSLCALIEDPDSCHEFFDAMADYKIEIIKHLKKYYMCDVVIYMDDYGMEDKMFMSLDMWREMIKPHLKKVIDATHELGMIYEHHSCGYIEPLIPEFVELGVDALDPVQASANPNAKKLKQTYGDKLTFVGCCDLHIFDRTGIKDDEIKKELRRVFNDFAAGGSYVSYPLSMTGQSIIPCLAETFRVGKNFYKR